MQEIAPTKATYSAEIGQIHAMKRAPKATAAIGMQPVVDETGGDYA